MLKALFFDFNRKDTYKNLYLTCICSHTARLAQSVERGTFNPEVKGSSPLSGDNFEFFIN